MTIGTGIGGGLILDGKLYHGASDVAGEIGHTTIDSTGRRCKCGNYGCLEAYASGPAIADRAREALGRRRRFAAHHDGRRPARAAHGTARVRGVDAGRRAWRSEVVRETARFIGTGIANLLNIFNPNVVVLAGGVAQAGEELFGPVRAEVRRRAFKPAVDACRIVPGELGGAAGVVGAVATFLGAASGGGVSRRKRLGVIGTFVWDVIHGRDPQSAPVEEWGGITYALSAFDAALPPDWELVPLVKVGEDLAPQAREFLGGLRRVAPDARPIDVPYRNNRVELFYTDAERRSEVLSGGIPGWSWLGLAPLVRDLDALYVNLISGFELDLPDRAAAAAALRRPDLLRPALDRARGAARRPAHAASAARRSPTGAAASTCCR